MIDLLIAGLLQGILEWLPVSSQGIISLLLTSWGYTLEQAVDIALFLHVGTLAATISYFWTDIKQVINPKSVKHLRILSFIKWTTLLTLIIGGPLYLMIPFLSSLLSDKVGVMIGVFLIITGVIQLLKNSFGTREYESITKGDGVINGFAQGVAALPGISRSGATTLALLIQGFDVQSALKLSFFASIPAIFMIQLYTGLKNGFIFNTGYVLAGITAFIIGRLTIKKLLQVAKKVNFAGFCIAFGLLNVLIPLSL
jgi:undecaprenyl-diphosphatase